MYCTNCGSKLGDGRFCSNCGKEVEDIEQEEQLHEQEPATVAISPKKKIVKPKLGIIAIVLVVILVVGILSKDYITYAISPELSVKLAAKETMDSIKRDYYKMESILFGDVNSSQSQYLNMNLSIEDASHTDEWVNQELYMLKGMGVGIESIYDDENKELIFNGKYQIAGEDIISAMVKLDDNELQLSIPELFESIISVPSKNFGEAWNSSIFGQESGDVVNNNLDLSISNLQKNNNIEEMDEETKIAYMDALKLIFKDSIYEKGGTSNLNIGNGQKKANKTIITVQEESLKEGIIALLDALKSDNRIEYWTDNLNQDIDYYEFNEAIEEAKREIRANFQMDSCTINLFTNNGNIVKSEIEIVADRTREDGTLSCNIELLGEKSPIDDFKLEFGVSDNEKFIWQSKGNHTGNNNIFLDETRVAVTSNYGEELLGEFSTEIDLKKKENNLKAKMSIRVDGEEMGIETIGDYNSSANSQEFKSKDIKFTYRDYYDNILEMTFGMDLKTGTDVTNKPDFGSYEKVHLFEMDEYELYEFIYSVEENAYWIGEKVAEHLGY